MFDFFLLEQQFLNTYSYYIICPHVEDTGGLSNYQTHRQRRRDIIHACTKVKYGRRKKMKNEYEKRDIRGRGRVLIMTLRVSSVISDTEHVYL